MEQDLIGGDGEYGIQLSLMPQLAEIVDKEDDWTGVTDAAERRKKQVSKSID